MKKIILVASIAIAIIGLTSACTANKKKKCNTCPKWTSEVISSQTLQRA